MNNAGIKPGSEDISDTSVDQLRRGQTVLMGAGWRSSGDTDTSQAGIKGALSIAQLWRGGGG